VQGDWPKSAQPLRTIVLRIAKRQGELLDEGRFAAGWLRRSVIVAGAAA
jgi:hypothetical protein